MFELPPVFVQALRTVLSHDFDQLEEHIAAATAQTPNILSSPNTEVGMVFILSNIEPVNH